jgi:hypothetical protein
MKRILVLLTVVALMAVMMAMTIAPAFAAPKLYRCDVGTESSWTFVAKKDVKSYEASGYTCVATSTL